MSFSQNRDIRSFEAAAAIDGYLFAVANGSNSHKVKRGAAGTDRIIGVVERVGVDAAGMADLTVHGRTEIRAGAAFDLGDPLTSDAQGRAVKAVPVAGSTIFIGGFAAEPATGAGDIVAIDVARSVLATPAA